MAHARGESRSRKTGPGRVRSTWKVRYHLPSHAAPTAETDQVHGISEGWIMTRNWIATASRALRMVGPGPARPRRHRMNPQLESLERRLSLSLSGAGTPTPMLNPQPLPPYAPPRPPIIGGGPTEDVVRKA